MQPPPVQQVANVAGHGNVVVQIHGDQNTVNWQPDRPALCLRSFAGSEHAQVKTGKPGDAGFTATGLQEAQFLSPFTRSLALRGRDAVRRDLDAWLHGPERIAVQVLIGGGGRGKTRLAVELAAAAREAGWLAGFVTGEELDRFRVQQTVTAWNWTQPVLVVVDYASAKATEIGRWLEDLTHHPAMDDAGYPPMRLLLLERHGGPDEDVPGSAWWRQAFGRGGQGAEVVAGLLAPGAPIVLDPIADPAERHAVFADAYAQAAGVPAPARSEALDAILVQASLGGEPLFLAMYGLLAARQGLAAVADTTADELALRLAKDELKRIGDVWRGHGLPVADRPLHAHLAAVATLCEGLTETQAYEAIEREVAALRQATPTGTEPVRAALHAALPGEGDGIAPILPDILGEAVLLVAWGKAPRGVEAVRRAAAANRDAVTRVVVRACQDFLIRGKQAPLAWLRALRVDAADLASLIGLANAMRPATIELRETALEFSEALTVRAREILGEAGDSGQDLLASSLNTLSHRLAELGRREAALAFIEEAVAIHRGLVAERPDAFLSDLAMSLSNFSNCLAELGRREAALAAVEEAVAAYRGLAAARPDVLLPGLAASLNNLSNQLAALGRWEAALAAAEETVAAYRGFAEARPDAFLPNLAASLNNLSVPLGVLGRQEAALAAIEEAVAIRRGLAAARPDAFLSDLASSLSNLSNQLGALDRREAALAAIEEAVAICRGLAVARPDAFLPDLAASLNNLSVQLGALGRREAALAAVEEAVAIRRGLATALPDAFLPNLAMSLNNLSVQLGALGRREAALAAIEEAVAIRRGLATARPDAFLPELAMSLGAKGEIFGGDEPEAAAAAFGEGVRALAPALLALPEAFAGLMRALCRDYLAACEAASLEPDMALLTPVAEILATLNPPDQG